MGHERTGVEQPVQRREQREYGYGRGGVKMINQCRFANRLKKTQIKTSLTACIQVPPRVHSTRFKTVVLLKGIHISIYIYI